MPAPPTPPLASRHLSAGVLAAALVALAAAAFGAPATAAAQARPAPRFETRCGWFENPTPSNAWLTDADGTWVISVQGGRQADGAWPTFKPRQWVKTNAGSYGYGCACMRVAVNRATKRVWEIASARPLELSACRADPALKEPAAP